MTTLGTGLNKSKKIITGGLLLLASMASVVVEAAAALPDAGQLSRELQQDQIHQQKKDTLNLPVPLGTEAEAPTTAQMPDDTIIAIRRVIVTGARKFSARSLQALVAYLAVGEHSLKQLEEGAAKLTAYYRKRGYFLANAYIPEQEIRNGTLTIAVQEGTLGEIKLRNSARIFDERIMAHLRKLDNGQALQKSEIDRQLLLLRGTVGVDKVNASLQGGAKPGTSDLLVETTPSAPYNGRIQLNNYGNRYTGDYQFGVSLNINSPLKIGDQLTIRTVGSNSDLLYGRLSYQVPVGADGLRIGAAYSHNHYELGREFKSLDAYGSSETATLFATYPLLLSQTGTLFGTVAYENKKLHDRMDSILTNTEKQVQLMSLGVSGEAHDMVNGGGRTMFDASLYVGHLNMDTIARMQDDSSARSSGDFVKAAYMVNRLQRITDQDTLSMILSGQWAGNNLNSSEKYSLGGIYGIRAYPQGEASGDMGAMLKLELAHHFTPQLRGTVFYDYGHIRINQDDFSEADNTRTLSGAGLGLNAALAGWQLDSYVAWPLQGGDPLSEPESSVHTPRLWMQMSGDF